MIDISIRVSAEMVKDAFVNEKMVAFGHLGTHFDCMSGLPARVAVEI